MATPRLIIDPDSLIVALESHEVETEWALNLRTGEVIPVINPAITGDRTAQDEIAREPNSYVYIAPIPSTQSFRIMESFVAGLPPGPARNRLLAALDRRHPFREFKSALLAFTALRSQWFRHHEQCMRPIAEDWLAGNNVNGVLGAAPTGERGV